ncbi:MAG: Glycosyl transferase, group 1, partial [Methanomicrobiales archaeon 53_19]
MNENDLCGISVVSYAVGRAFSNPVSNLLNILSATYGDTYVIIGAQGQTHFQKLNDSVHICAFPYQPESTLIMKILRHGILQLNLSIKLFLTRKCFQDVIFFMVFPPILPMLTVKLCNKKIYWSLSAEIRLSSNGTSSEKLAAVLSKICYNLCNSIILYSPALISEWNLEPYRHKIRIAHEHFLDFNAFTVTTPLPDRPPFIGYIGRLSGEKGVQHFTKALPAILSDRQDLRVLIGGDGALKKAIEASLQ